MPNTSQTLKYALISAEQVLDAPTYGSAVMMAEKIKSLGLPSPHQIALSCETVRYLGEGKIRDLSPVLADLKEPILINVLPSVENSTWGGPGQFRDVGLNNQVHTLLTESFGKDVADKRYADHIQNYSCNVMRLDPEAFEHLQGTADPVSGSLEVFQNEVGGPFPQNPADQLLAVLSHMARMWESATARLLRQAFGAPAEAGLGLILMDCSWSSREDFIGLGEARSIDVITGQPGLVGNIRRLNSTAADDAHSMVIRDCASEGSFGHSYPEAFASLMETLGDLQRGFKDALTLEFALSDNGLLITNAVYPKLETKALISLCVSMAQEGTITREEALLRVDPKSLSELLHAKVDPGPDHIRAFTGVPASPGGAAGRLVFSSDAAVQMAAADRRCILVRRETSPEDVRGLLASDGVVTERGGATSHAAVITRGLGVPCVTGVSNVIISEGKKQIILSDGTILGEGDQLTIDGSNGVAYIGQVPMREPSLDKNFEQLMAWADDVRQLEVRANADTPEDALMAQKFNADGIGLCRTEHMFFEPARMTVMHEMIFAENAQGRRAALDRLLPMQQSDFKRIFETMVGKSVCIRLFDPPLHEFLPTDRESQIALAEALNLSVNHVIKRIEAMAEYNPMLGLRGVRLGITDPEIYDMQITAILQAAIDASAEIGQLIVPEIMIPLVSTKREVDIIKKRMDQVAADLQSSTKEPVRFKLGVLLETPRAVLRATDIAEHAEIISFGTNDLTQMAFGMSRDDVGRFVAQYLESGAFEADPFSKLDIKGVGELMKIGAERARAGRPDVVLTLCGEHAAEVDVIEFCAGLGFRYVSCSPYRVPIARLATAQLALR